jgi:hypothetical protein
LNGVHTFSNQRYIDTAGKSTYFLNAYESIGLRELTAFYSNRLSYRDLSDLLLRVVGQKVCSVRQLQYQVVSESKAVATYLTQAGVQLSFNFVSAVDIYAAESAEVLYFDDGVGVKRQKEHRRRAEAEGSKSSATVQSDIVVIGNDATGYHYLSSAEAVLGGSSLEDCIHLMLSKQYGGKPLPLVAITDGAQCIRCRLRRLFGQEVVILLDWYHLGDKIRQYCSRLGVGKALKEVHIAEMLHYLWMGQTTEALIYSDQMIQTKQTMILEELQNYLRKHQAEICNYDKRSTAGKVIGSGRGEKANDQLVAHRQKKKAMSWSEEGSNALTVLKSLEMNQLWDTYWQIAA